MKTLTHAEYTRLVACGYAGTWQGKPTMLAMTERGTCMVEVRVLPPKHKR